MDYGRRLQWVRRPRWWLIFGLCTVFLAWLLWPIRVYQSSVNNFLMVAHEENPELLGVVRLKWSDSPWTARDEMEAWVAAQATPGKVEMEGRVFWWSEQFGLPKTLAFRRQNAFLVLEPSDEFLGLSRGEPAWTARIERHAVEIDEELRKGILGGKELEGRRVPRYRLRYGEQIEKFEKRVKTAREKWFP